MDTDKKPVPFLDLKAQYESIREEISPAIEAVIARTAFAGGPFVAEFEQAFADSCGVTHAVGVSSGTAALWVALLALGIGEGDEVITVPNSFIATAEAITFAGAVPVFVDIDEETYTIDPDLIEPAITPRTRAIIPVHLFGQTADMDPVLNIAERHGLYVVEDAAQAHGAEYRGKPAGSFGHAGCFSFYPGKNLGAYGEAGAVVTSDPKLAQAVRMLRDHGQAEKYQHAILGWNARMDGIQGAVLNVKLRHLQKWNNKRRAHAAEYRRLLAGLDGLVLPSEAPYAKHVYHVYAIRAKKRDELIRRLREKEIHCGIHYPVPIHLQPAYESLGLKVGSFPVTERCARELVSLPMFPELTGEQIGRVASEVRSIVGGFG